MNPSFASFSHQIRISNEILEMEVDSRVWGGAFSAANEIGFQKGMIFCCSMLTFFRDCCGNMFGGGKCSAPIEQ